MKLDNSLNTEYCGENESNKNEHGGKAERLEKKTYIYIIDCFGQSESA